MNRIVTTLKNTAITKTVAVTSLYILFVILVNTLFLVVPPIHIFGVDLVLGELVVGAIYIVRDFAQREIGHYVFFAMIAAALISYVLADPTIALASLAAFSVGEIIDWLIFTFTKRPLSKRLLLSAGLSAPIDSWIFLHMTNHLATFDLILMTSAKIVGILVLWLSWKMHTRAKAIRPEESVQVG